MDQKANLSKSPFLKQPLADIPKFDTQFYIDEFLRWLSEDYFETSATDKVNTDYTIQHQDWPRLVDSKPKRSEWDSLTREDNLLSLNDWDNFGSRNISFTLLIFANAILTAIKEEY